MILIIPIAAVTFLVALLVSYIIYKALVGFLLGVGDAWRYWSNKRKYGL